MSFQTLVISQALDDGHPGKYEEGSHCCLICISLMTNDAEHLSMRLLAIPKMTKSLPAFKLGCWLAIIEFLTFYFSFFTEENFFPDSKS